MRENDDVPVMDSEWVNTYKGIRKPHRKVLMKGVKRNTTLLVSEKRLRGNLHSFIKYVYEKDEYDDSGKDCLLLDSLIKDTSMNVMHLILSDLVIPTLKRDVRYRERKRRA